MSFVAAPSSSFEAFADGFATGLTGTIGVRILDNAGGTTTARSTSGIVEYPSGSGRYEVTLTAPSTAGQYTLFWDNGSVTPGNVASDDLIVSATAMSISAAGDLYVTAAQLKQTLNIGSTYADDDIDIAVAAASRAVDGYTSDRFYPTSETRYYTGLTSDCEITIDSLNTLTSVTVDTAGTGTYSTTWTNNTHFTLGPINAALEGFPYTKLKLRAQSGSSFPGYENGVKIVGSFGWAETPAAVAQAASILAGRLLKRSRETPYGILTVTGDAVAAARLGRIDPDVAFLLDNLPGTVPLLAI